MPRKAAALVFEKTKKISRSIPSSENGHGVLCKDKDGVQYTISNNPTKEHLAFTLWKHLEKGYEKIATGDAPTDLYPLIQWR